MTASQEETRTNGTEPSIPETVNEWADGLVKHSLKGVTATIAHQLAESTKGSLLPISGDIAEKVIPFAGAGVTGLAGMILAGPLSGIGEGIGRLLHHAVTGFGYFEKIPLVGGFFSVLSGVADAIGGALGYVMTAVASILMFKALQPYHPDKVQAQAGPQLGGHNFIAPGAARAKDAEEKRAREEEEKEREEERKAKQEEEKKREEERKARQQEEERKTRQESEKKAGEERARDGRPEGKEASTAERSGEGRSTKAAPAASAEAAAARRPVVSRSGLDSAANTAARGLIVYLTFKPHDFEHSTAAEAYRLVTGQEQGLREGAIVEQGSEKALLGQVFINDAQEAIRITKIEKAQAGLPKWVAAKIHFIKVKKDDKGIYRDVKGTEGEIYGVDPSRHLEAAGKVALTLAAGGIVAQFTRMDAALNWAGGVVKSGKYVKPGLPRFALGYGIKGAGAVAKVAEKGFLPAYVLLEGLDVGQAYLEANNAQAPEERERLKDRADTKAEFAAGKLAIMMTGPWGVIAVVVADVTQVEDVAHACNDIAAMYPKATRKFCVIGKDGRPEELTLKNLYKLNPHFQAAVEQAALAGTGRPLGKEEREKRMEKMLGDPLYAWMVIWNRAHKDNPLQLDTRAHIDEARAKLEQCAAQHKEDLKPSFGWALIKAVCRQDVNFESYLTQADMAVIAKELIRYNQDIGAARGAEATGTGTAAQPAPKAIVQAGGQTALPEKPQPVVAVAGASDTAVGFLPAYITLKELLKDGMVTGYQRQQQDRLTALMRHDAQVYENEVAFVKEARAALDDPEKGRAKLLAFFTDPSRKAKLTTDEAQALVVDKPKLRTTVIPGSAGEHFDGENIPRLLDDFGRKFDAKYKPGFFLLRAGMDGKEPARFLAKGYDRMSVTEKHEFLKRAIDYYTRRSQDYVNRFWSAEPSSLNAKTGTSSGGRAAFYDYSESGPQWFDPWLVALWMRPDTWRTEGKVALPDGSAMSYGEELQFFKSLPLQWKQQDDSLAAMIFGKTFEVDKSLTMVSDYLTRELQKHMQYMKDAEVKENGEIRKYKLRLQLMKASFELEPKGILLIASSRTNDGIDPATGQRREGSWILYKDTNSGQYYYAEGTWDTYRSDADSTHPQEFFRVSAIRDKATNEKYAVRGPLVLNFADMSKDTSISSVQMGHNDFGSLLASPDAFVTVTRRIQALTPKQRYNAVAAAMQNSLTPPEDMFRSRDEFSLCSYEQLGGDTSLALGSQASMDCSDGHMKYTLKGTWALDAAGTRTLKPHSVVLHLPEGKDCEVKLADSEKMGELRGKILREYVTQLAPKQRSDFFFDLDFVRYKEFETDSSFIMPSRERREQAIAERFAEESRAREKARRDALETLKVKFGQWIAAGMVAIEHDPSKQVSVTQEDSFTRAANPFQDLMDRQMASPFELPMKRRGAPISYRALRQVVEGQSAVILNLSDKDMEEFRQLLRTAGIKLPELDGQLKNHEMPLRLIGPRSGTTPASGGEVLLTLPGSDGIRLSLASLAQWMPDHALMSYCGACIGQQAEAHRSASIFALPTPGRDSGLAVGVRQPDVRGIAIPGLQLDTLPNQDSAEVLGIDALPLRRKTPRLALRDEAASDGKRRFVWDIRTQNWKQASQSGFGIDRPMTVSDGALVAPLALPLRALPNAAVAPKGAEQPH